MKGCVGNGAQDADHLDFEAASATAMLCDNWSQLRGDRQVDISSQELLLWSQGAENLKKKVMTDSKEIPRPWLDRRDDVTTRSLIGSKIDNDLWYFTKRNNYFAHPSMATRDSSTYPFNLCGLYGCVPVTTSTWFHVVNPERQKTRTMASLWRNLPMRAFIWNPDIYYPDCFTPDHIMYTGGDYRWRWYGTMVMRCRN
jgi:hypothetical protein